MRDLDDLFSEACWGRLTHDEIAYIASKIKEVTVENQEQLNLRSWLYALGRGTMRNGMPAQFRSLVEPFLYYPSDPWISATAYKVLIACWGYDKEYLQQTKDFMRGVEWDEYSCVRNIAISLAGEFLRNTFEKELFELLIQIFEGKRFPFNKDLYVDLDQRLAYCALARADGWDHADLPPPGFDIIELLGQGHLNLDPIKNAQAKIHEHSSK